MRRDARATSTVPRDVPCVSCNTDTRSQSFGVVRVGRDHSPSAVVGRVGRTCVEVEGVRGTGPGVVVAASASLDLVAARLVRSVESALAHQGQHLRLSLIHI